MTTIAQLYNNIKTFVLQTFESKEEEDINVPIEVEGIIHYVDGRMFINSFIELEVTGSSFSTFSSTPFTYIGKVFIDWGDNSGLIEYEGGQLTHTYPVEDNYIIKIYGGITSIENQCFHNKNNLISINIPDSVTTLKALCLGYCFGLTSVTIPNGVTTIRGSCFTYCQSLTSITIPKSVTTIESSCFFKCTGLTTINLQWNISSEIITYTESWISYANPNLKFYVPHGTKLLYVAKGYPSNKVVEVSD